MKQLNVLGTSGLNYVGEYVYEEFLPELQYPRAAAVYKEMSDNDPTIGAILYLIEHLVRRADWHVASPGDTAQDRFATNFVEECMHDMSQSWDSFICEVLSMVVYGFSFHEIVYKIRRGTKQTDGKYRSKYSDGLLGWRKMPSRAQSTLYGWHFDDFGDVKGFIQWAPPKYEKVEIPLSKGLLFRTRVDRDNPEGRSLLRNAYRPWYFKKRIEEIEGIGIERDLAGLPTLISPEGVNIWDNNNPTARMQRQESENLVRNIRRDCSEGVVLPYGWDLKLLSTGGARQFDTTSIINRYDNRIAMTMLADIVMMGSSNTGSFALSSIKKSLLAYSLETLVKSIADVLNTYAVPQLMQVNNFEGLTDYPKIYADEIEVPELKDVAFILRASGLQATSDLGLMNLIRKLLSLDPLSEEEFTELYPKPEVEEKVNVRRDLARDAMNDQMQERK